MFLAILRVLLVGFRDVTRVPNRDSPPAILLRESDRAGGKVRVRTLQRRSGGRAGDLAGGQARERAPAQRG